MKYLIVTADDLGLTKSINEGITKAYREGIVNSISVSSAGEAFDDACRVVKDLKLEEINAHLALTEMAPVQNPSEVKSLITKEGVFYKGHSGFLLKFLSAQIDMDEVYSELRGQMHMLSKIGVNITSINAHEHIHMVPKILEIFVRLAKEYNVPSIRYPHGDRLPNSLSVNDIYRSFLLKHFSARTLGILDGADICHTNFFLGLLDAGKLDAEVLLSMLKDLKYGITELVCHPGFLSPEVIDNYRWHLGAETELFALTSQRVKDLIKKEGIELTTYGKLPSLRR